MGIFRRAVKPEPTQERRQYVIDPNTGYVADMSERFPFANDQTVLSLPAFYRAVSIKADLISSLPFKAYDGDVELAEQPRLIMRPDPTEDRADTLSRIVTSLLLRGNAVALLGGDEYPNQIKVVPVDQVTTIKYPNGTFTYKIGQDEYDPSAIMHIRNSMLLPGELWGLSVVQACRRSLDRAVRVNEYSRTYFADNATPSGIIKPGYNLADGEAAQIKADWMNAMRGKREPVVFSRTDADFVPFTISPQDSQFIETELQTLTDIANCVGVPGYFIGAKPGGSLTYENPEQLGLLLAKYFLPELSRIERAFTALLPDGISARFTLDWLLRPDTQTRITTLSTAVESGIYTKDEARALENLPPLEDAA